MKNPSLIHAVIACLASFASAVLLVSSIGDSKQHLQLNDASLERIAGLNDPEKNITFSQVCANALLVPGGRVVADCTQAGLPNGSKCLACTGFQPSYGTIQSGTTGGPGSFAVTGSVFSCSALQFQKGGCINGQCGRQTQNGSCDSSQYQQYAEQS